MLARQNDFIIKGVNGEYYPCKPDIFEKTYESAELPACADVPDHNETVSVSAGPFVTLDLGQNYEKVKSESNTCA